MSRPSSGRLRLMIVTRDRFPATRVDLTELFSRHLTARFEIDWVMARAAHGPGAALDGRPGERFLVSRRGGLAFTLLQLRQAVRVLRRKVDVVQVRDAALSAALFRIASWIGGRPFVYWMSFPMVEGYRHRARSGYGGGPAIRLARLIYAVLAGALLYRLVLPGADRIVVQSERMKADLVAKGLRPDRITAVPMGVSTDLYHPGAVAPATDPRLEGRRALVYLGALDPNRHVEMLIDMLALLACQRLDCTLVLVGEATAREDAVLRQAAEAAGVQGRLIFTGRLPLAEALSYVRRADVCLAPFPVWPEHYLSATPTKLVEYLAMGRPVVASEHPDQSAVVRESGAGVLAPATAEGFAAAVAALLADPDRAEAMGARGPAWAARHRDYAVLAAEVAAVYDALRA